MLDAGGKKEVKGTKVIETDKERKRSFNEVYNYRMFIQLIYSSVIISMCVADIYSGICIGIYSNIQSH